MKKSRFTEEQIAYALRLVESGTVVADVCRQTLRAGALDTGTLSGQRPARLSAGYAATCHLVLEVPGARHHSPAHADSGDCLYPTTIRLCANLDHAAARGLVRWPESNPSSVSPRWFAGPAYVHRNAVIVPQTF